MTDTTLPQTPAVSTAPRIIFYVQYLLGIGHVRRSSLIVQALCNQGAQVHVIFGGMPVNSMSFGAATMHQLMAIKSADAAFSALVKADNSEFTEDDKKKRSQALLAICEEIQPDLIVTETYPFGRRQMRFELLPLLNWVQQNHKAPVMVASVRDILQRRSHKREQECVDLVNQHYQHVLVHGDPRFYPLERSFPLGSEIHEKVSYSGYVCPVLNSSLAEGSSLVEDSTQKKIVISIGGGSVGKEIIATALALFKSGFENDKHWLFITGPNMDPADKQLFAKQLAELNHPHLQIVELAANFLQELVNAHASISMAGYNTIMDLLLTKVAAVVVPFEGEGETEQLARSKVLAKANVLQLVTQKELSVQSLQKSIENAVKNAKRLETGDLINIDNQGATHSANLLIEWASKPKKASNLKKMSKQNNIAIDSTAKSSKGATSNE